jgi:hypothetical protein
VPHLCAAFGEAPPCACNNFGGHTTTVVNSAPDHVIGVMLDKGSHLDSEGASTDSAGVQFCGPVPLPQNATVIGVGSASIGP